ncbi:Sterol regulatory element-binding protein-like protein [Hapsidospora chrysogenum ATCC 11550]|uniref:Sterol regulatory element-binding protein-like protein n=1 Tax=Hapsidospora chrysogenum (strain ATCC 11550 / CBS 779.69 / DSM 880 / IAM 14645 / JCM 23072 / IMI 49137) TaxID=857340 RepID=A0A086TI23_HAPC1|nr:Sterol regulatory element-binding protein-like protein [Hapsidospora chrysogenum ATCC 11550]
MAPPKERKRKFHRRSKTGCQICKKRHVRCDERKPLCTSCLQSGNECIYPVTGEEVPLDGSSDDGSTKDLVRQSPAMAGAPGLKTPLSDFVGGSYEILPESSKRLLRHFSQYAVWGERPVSRELESSVIHRAFENPGYMHMCLMLSACQWAWVHGSMDEVRVPFLYHKSATYQFAREQLLRPETAQSGDTMLAISALALAEGAIGDLDTSSKHLKGFRLAMQSQRPKASLPQKMFKIAGEGLRASKSAKLVNVPDYQPTFMALLFASIWDLSVLPPTEAPRYGWWEESDTQAARLWQNHTKDLNLDYEISRGFDPNTYQPRILNGDPRSSRTCFIATFFYLFAEVGNGQMDTVLVDWLLEQLIEDVNANEASIQSNTWAGPIWLWCAMFGAAIASSGRASSHVEQKQLDRWISLYGEKIKIVSRALGLLSWEAARFMLTRFLRNMDDEVDEGLKEIWTRAMARDEILEPMPTHRATASGHIIDD